MAAKVKALSEAKFHLKIKEITISFFVLWVPQTKEDSSYLHI
jgi:hypothetical protein